MATSFAKVNRTYLERGRGVPNGITTMRKKIKSEVVTLISDVLTSGKKEELVDQLNKYAETSIQSGVPYATHYIRSLFGLSPKNNSLLTQAEIDQALSSQKSLTLPIVEVIPEMCEKCTDDVVTVSDLCMSCTSHPCSVVCPVEAVHVYKDRTQKTTIDPSKCIRCEQCIKVCPYEAIIHRWRPCKAACGVEAIQIKKDLRSEINESKCVSCGLCTTACPFGAIVHKSEIGVVAAKLSNKERTKHLAAIVAPAFVNQYGKSAPADIFEGIKKCGFDSVIEVAYGADLDTVEIASKLHEKEPGKGYIGTSCCPAWVKTVKKHFPKEADHIVGSFAPMVETAQALKRMNPNLEVVFIGPCIAKIMEILEEPMKGHVEHAITFEELQALFDAKKIKLVKSKNKLNQASAYGRGYACAGGVADAVVKAAQKIHGMKNIQKYAADTLFQCREMLTGLENGTIKADIVEGMACPGGCVGGAGTCAPPNKTKSKVLQFKSQAKLTLDDSLKQNYKNFEF